MDFVEELRLFRERTTIPSYRALVLLGTGQSTTAALLLGTLKLDYVAFLLTEKSRSFPDKVASKIGSLPVNCEYLHLKDASAIEVYEELKSLLERWQQINLPSSEIAVDVTGGTKPMTVGLAKAAHVLNLATIYVESNYADDEKGIPRPIPGTQWLQPLPDPYTVFGDLEHAEAKRLFNSPAFDYNGAARIWEHLVNRISTFSVSEGLKQLIDSYTLWTTLSRAYADWNAFNVKDASYHFEKLLNLSWYNQLDPEVKKVLQQQYQIIRYLCELKGFKDGRGTPKISFLENLDYVLALLGSIYQNGLRRAKQGRYDLAALLMYRCLELISQRRLAKYGILTIKPDYSQALKKDSQLGKHYTQKLRYLGSRSGQRLPVDSISLFQGYVLLDTLRDELLCSYEIARIRDRSDARNQSILAHGTNFITESEYQGFAEVVEELMQRFFKVENRRQDQWQEEHTFIQAV